MISMIVDRKYPYLKNNHQTLQKEERKKILANISSMMLHKVGNVIINSTDNILISSMVGIIFAGLYSNYLRFLYKGIIINHNKKLSQPTLKRRFFKKKAAFFSWPGLGKEWC